jgi:serine/threonine-protein kinase
MEDKAANPDQMPESIGRYKILEGIGFGAMGAVYKAFDPLIKRTLAIKTIRLDIPRQSPQYKAFIERFQHEARISGTLSHSNIVTLFDIGDENGIPFLAMEYVDGQTVAARIEAGHRFKPEHVISLASQVASAIDYAHSKGVIHRDIKPSNLILHEDDRVKVTDFGIAKLADSEMTQSGTLLGTPSYMSPEQAMGDRLDGRSDIFSLGVCCFEMLSGEQPFPGTNVTSILYKLVHVDPVEPANLEMNGLVPRKWHEVFGKVLAKRPDDRYQTATAFVQDLEYCLGEWFGAVDAEDASVQGGGDSVRTVSMHVPPAEDQPATVIMAAPREDDLPATVVMRAPDADAATVVLKAPEWSAPRDGKGQVQESRGPAVRPPAPGPPPAPPKAAPPAKAAPPTPARSAPPRPPAVPSSSAAAVSAAEEPTVRVQLPQTVKMAAPPAEETVTVRVPPVARTPPPAPPADSLATQQPTPLSGEPAPAVRRSGVPPALVLGGGALALLLGLLTAWLLLRSGGASPSAPETSPTPLAESTPAEAPTPTPTVAPASLTLRVETTPPGAMVTVNGQSQGTSPLEVNGLAAGDYDVRVELKGHDPKVQRVTLSEVEPLAHLQVALARVTPTAGTADFLSTPIGAAVIIDGSPAGQTPLLQQRLKAGPHRIELAKEGHETWSGTLTVEVGKRAKVEAILRAVAVATPPPVPTPEPVDTTRIFNNVPSDVDTLAKRIAGSSPTYPSDLPKLRSGDSASVVVTFVVTEEGEVTDAKISQSGGSRALDEAVLTAVKKWKYSPAVKRGVKVKVRIAQKQTFLAG